MIKRVLPILVFPTALAGIALAFWATPAPESDWKIAGPFGGTATTITLDPKHPQTLLAGGMNSLLFRSEDGGASWHLLGNFPKRNLSEVTTVLIDPADSNHYLAGMVAAEGGGLFESWDAGNTWTAAKDISDCGVRALAVSKSDPSRMVAGTLSGVMESTDSGKTWKRISDTHNLEMQGITAVAIDPADPNIVYAGTTHLPWRTTDGGKTWESIHTGMIDDSDVFSIYVKPGDPNEVFASACSGIYETSNRGDEWHKLMGIPNTSRRTHVVRWESGTCCGDPGSGAVYAGTTTGLFRSLNDGKTWRTLTDTQVNALAFDPSQPNTLYLALEYSGIGKSMNGGEKIDLINNGFVDRSISAATVSGKRLIALETQEGETTGIFASADRGETWAELRDVRGLGGVHLKTIAGLPDDGRTLLAASPHQFYKSVDGGLLWKPITVRVATTPAPAKTPPRTTTRTRQTARTRTTRAVKPREVLREIHPSEINNLYVTRDGEKNVVFAATDLGLLKTTDMGERWTVVDIAGATNPIEALYLAPNANGYMIARSSAGLYVSKDFGEHWTQLQFPLPMPDINEVAIPSDSSAPLLVATRVGLYLSPDGGGQWSANASHIPASTVSSVIYSGAGKTAYAVEYGRLYESKDGGNSWTELPTALPSLRIRQLWMPDATSDRLYAITGDLGIIFRN